MNRASSAVAQDRQVVCGHSHLGAAADGASVLGWRGCRGDFEGRVAMWVFGRSLHGYFREICRIAAGSSGGR